jgi:uncharacterized Zn-finger protein
MQPFETLYVDTKIAACNGGGGAAGHPLVYLNVGPNNRVECPYCSRLYIYEKAKHDSAKKAPAAVGHS